MRSWIFDEGSWRRSSRGDSAFRNILKKVFFTNENQRIRLTKIFGSKYQIYKKRHSIVQMISGL